MHDEGRQEESESCMQTQTDMQKDIPSLETERNRGCEIEIQTTGAGQTLTEAVHKWHTESPAYGAGFRQSSKSTLLMYLAIGDMGGCVEVGCGY